MLTREKDPLIHKANNAIQDHDLNKDLGGPKGQTAVHASLLAVIPWCVFVLVLFTMFESFYKHQLWCGLVFGSIIACSVVGIVVSDVKKRWLHFLGVLCIVASCVGAVSGFYNHYKNMVYYYTYGDMRKYTNVAGSQTSQQFGDAGMVLFTGDTHIDTTRAVGYKNAEDGGTWYCVAPVMDSSMGQTDPISFWAVGTNCCEPRAHFACDDAGVGGARSALFLLEKEFLVPPSMEWAVEGLGSRESFAKAIRLEQAAFATVAAKTTTLVRWSKDPVKLQHEYKEHGIQVMAYACAVYAVVSIVLGNVIAYSIKPKKKSIH